MEFSLFNACQFIIIGLMVGFMGGFLGVGGGVIIIPLLTYWVFPSLKVPKEVVIHLAFGTSLAIIIPTSISGAFAHARNGNISWRIVFLLALPGIGGSFLGATIASSLRGELLKIFFGVLLFFLSGQMFLEKRGIGEACDERPSQVKYGVFLVGFIVGLFSGFFGLGGGVIAIPLMVRFLRISIHRAMGISIAFVFFISLVGTLGYIFHGWENPQLPPFSLGYVHGWGWIMAGIPSLFLARLGASLAFKTQPLRLRRIFALLLLGVGLRMLF
ncbi:MAG: sulfite exporter TauE/SafE family protein [Thermodesulfobacteriota bacterium]